jgi:hypothetical protein
MDDETLLELNRQGFIPGPGETEDRFLQRVQKTKEKFFQQKTEFDWAKETIFELFDFSPESLPVLISNRGLKIWEAAACWIEDGVPLLQIRSRSIRRISKQELLAHEAIHAARAGFDEIEFEEFFAFASAEKRWRRIFGPIVRRNWEVWPFLASCTFVFTFLGVLPVCALSLFALFRLYNSQKRLKNAADFLNSKLEDEKKVRSILFRLTDHEISKFAEGIWLDGDQSLRWRLLRLAYFS